MAYYSRTIGKEDYDIKQYCYFSYYSPNLDGDYLAITRLRF